MYTILVLFVGIILGALGVGYLVFKSKETNQNSTTPTTETDNV